MSWNDGCKVYVLACVLAIAVLGGDALAQTEPRFLMACAPCHGFDGVGYDSATPNLAGQSRDYLHAQLTAFRSGARRHPQMSFFSRQMTPEEMQQIIDYYARLPVPR
jgi:cytochrome c553